jgi:hypothetical protein
MAKTAPSLQPRTASLHVHGRSWSRPSGFSESGATAAIGAGAESISMVRGQQNMNNLVNPTVHEA